MKIGVLGGSFDPPHVGHTSLAEQIIAKKIVDEVWFVPCNQHSFNKQMSPVENRLNMVKMVTGNVIKVSEIEIRRGGVSYTIDTLNELHRMYPNNQFFWIMGSDQVEFFPKYKSWQEILARHNLIIFPREKDASGIIEKVKKHWRLQTISPSIIILDPKEFKINNISSSKIREMVKMGKNIGEIVNPFVKKYITEVRLYHEQ